MQGEILMSAAAIVVLLLMSSFFSGSETALTAASRARMHRLASEGNMRAGRVRDLLEDSERLIGSILLGNNLVNIFATALATALFTELWGEAGVGIATGAMTLLVLIFAEVMPKTYAISNPDRMALVVSAPIRILTRLLSPVVALVQQIVRGLLRLFGIRIDATWHVLSPHEEIRGALDLHVQEGGMVKRDRDMLGSILDLNDVSVEEVMVHRSNLQMIDASLPPAEIVRQVLESPYTRLPLWRDDQENIVGVLHAKDVLRAVLPHQDKVDTLDMEAIAADPWFVPETTSLLEQLNAFRARRAHFALVVDEYGALMGVVTLEDIIEEIVGEIEDEHDIGVPGIRTQRDDTIIVDGTVTIRDANRALDWNLPDDEATTIAGLVIHEAQAIPEPGQVFIFHGVRFEILRRQRNQITMLRMRALSDLAD